MKKLMPKTIHAAKMRAKNRGILPILPTAEDAEHIARNDTGPGHHADDQMDSLHAQVCQTPRPPEVIVDAADRAEENPREDERDVQRAIFEERQEAAKAG